MPAASTHSEDVTYDPFVIKLQEIIVKLLCKIANRGVEPTRLNTNKYNSHILCDIRDIVLAKETNKGRKEALRGLWNYAIIKHETCTFYSDHLDEVLKLWKESDWIFIESEEQRKKALVEAMNNKEFSKVLNLIK